MFSWRNSNQLSCDCYSLDTLRLSLWIKFSTPDPQTDPLTVSQRQVWEHLGHFGFFCRRLPLDCNRIPAVLWLGNSFKMAHMQCEKPALCGITYFDDLWKKIHKIKFGLETTDQTHTHSHTHMDLYSMRTHTLTICGTLRHSFTPPSLSHTCIHTNLHSLIWADSGNRSSELARGPGRGGGVEGGWEGDQREDENSRLAEKKQKKKKERRKESFEREEKRKENFLCSWALRIQERDEIWNPSI